MIRTSLSLLGWMSLWIMLCLPLRALEVRQSIWGFDGRLVPGCFNPVSILVDNPSPSTYDGQLILERSEMGMRGTDYVQAIFLAPRSTRWVQFHVFVGTSAGNYRLRWGARSGDGLDLPEELKFGPPACVWLRDATSAFASTGALRAFPDELFPTTVAATEGLDAVALDHAPAWEAARREAFLDWVRLGGTVHLLPGADGKFPAFAEGLEILNVKQEKTPYGSGRIVRHEAATRDFTERYLEEHGYPVATLRQNSRPPIYDLEGTLSQHLASLTRPKVNWTVIHLLAIAYVAAIGPLHFRYRRKLDYRVSILVFLVTVGIFGTLFAVVGRRGYGESQTVNSLTIARSLSGGRYDTMQWISAFATIGDIYSLTHEAPGNLYSPIGLDSGANRVVNGKDGHIDLDIPLYSARTFVHSGVMKADDASVTAEKERDGAGPQDLRFRIGPGFPSDYLEARLFVGDEFFDLARHDGFLKTSSGAKAVKEYLGSDRLSSLTFNSFSLIRDTEGHRSLLPLVVARALNLPDSFAQTIVKAPRDPRRWKVCIVAPAPDSFRLRGTDFGHERGWVVYVQDLLPPD